MMCKRYYLQNAAFLMPLLLKKFPEASQKLPKMRGRKLLSLVYSGYSIV
jgi:hypothetical protein